MEELKKFIVFQLNTEHYGVHIQQVLSIEKVTHITPVPNTSPFIQGVMNLRGEITPVIDLKGRLQIGTAEHTASTRILIVHINDTQVGLLVDSATDVIDLEQSLIDSPPETVGSLSGSYINGVAKVEEKLLILLDLEKVLNLEEMSEAKQAAGSTNTEVER
ncbi:chemotaxis protein CheW [Virgibacillus sediminis]|uniref:Chemotaxis protein CheW n=1 Tax=Virgibacillus sediminis TaxID=202260 RepID=A0ABV7A3T8_9BACI